MNNQILVVGGYGHVGRIVSHTLGKLFPGKVIAAGRNYQKAKELSLETEGKVMPLELDICSTAKSIQALDQVGVVVMCVEPNDLSFVQTCLQRGIHYVDVSGGYEYLARIESLKEEAIAGHATAVLSVGLTPGLTNLLASYCKSHLSSLCHVDMFIMLGLGEVHGEAALRWTFDNMNSHMEVREGGRVRRVGAFEESKRVRFAEGPGQHTAYRFNVADQYIVLRTLGVDTAASWLCFDSKPITYLFFLLKKLGVFTVLRHRWAMNALVTLSQTIHFGSDRFAVQVVAYAEPNARPSRYECSILGRGEGKVTGLVAAEVAKALSTLPFPSGVFHMEELFEPGKFIKSLASQNLKFNG